MTCRRHVRAAPDRAAQRGESQVPSAAPRRSKVHFAPASFLPSEKKKSSARSLAPPFPQKGTLGSPARLQAPSRRLAVAANLLRVRVHFNIFRRRIFFLPVDTSLWTTHRSRRRFSYLKQTRLTFTPPLLLFPQSQRGTPNYKRYVPG